MTSSEGSNGWARLTDEQTGRILALLRAQDHEQLQAALAEYGVTEDGPVDVAEFYEGQYRGPSCSTARLDRRPP